MLADHHPLILYDSVCGFCNRTVQFLLKHDTSDRFRFASLQSELAKRILSRHGLNADVLETTYLVEDFDMATERLLTRSAAAVKIWSHLERPWNFVATLLRWMPGFVADAGYKLIARYRYRIFGKYDRCPLPDPKNRDKFLDV